MRFKIDSGKINDKRLMQAIQQLYFSLGYFRVKKKFPPPENALNILCRDFFKERESCSKCPLEKITSKDEGKPLCFYIRNKGYREIAKDLTGLAKRLESIASGRNLISLSYD